MTERLLEPPVIVGVAPTRCPDDDSIVTSCGTGALLVKSIVTLPAFALSDLVLKASWPSGFASSVSFSDPLAGAGVEDVAELVVGAAAEVVVGACAAVLAEEELDEELPHPASASRAAASASEEIKRTERFGA